MHRAASGPPFPLTSPAFYGVVLLGAHNTINRRTTPPDSMALFCALFLKVKMFLGCLLGYACIQCLPGVPDMSRSQD